MLDDLDAIAADWDELKGVVKPGPIDPRRDERLLEPATILQAVRKIGPELSQALYWKMAGEDNADARREASRRLAEGRPEDAAQSIPILRNLLADEDQSVRMEAAVSLLILGQNDVQKQILDWLRSADRWQPRQIALLLDRVEDGTRLTFARENIEKVAAQKWYHNSNVGRLRALLKRIPQR
jgi:hypothetical protein